MADLNLLPGVSADRIRVIYGAAPGNEIASGKFASPESSAALVANSFGFFLDRVLLLPSLPHGEAWGWPAKSIALEGIVRFPWNGGRHPCLDVLIETDTTLIGVESKRYEPFRPKSPPDLSDAYWRPVWGDRMRGFETVRDGLRDGTLAFEHLDAAQLIKHAFGLRTAVNRTSGRAGKKAVLFYLYAEPSTWPNGAPISDSSRSTHRREIDRFGGLSADSEVQFCAASYRDVLSGWRSGSREVRDHATAVAERFML